MTPEQLRAAGLDALDPRSSNRDDDAIARASEIGWEGVALVSPVSDNLLRPAGVTVVAFARLTQPEVTDIDGRGALAVTHVERGVTLVAAWADQKPSRSQEPADEDDDEEITPLTITSIARCSIDERLPDLVKSPGTLLPRLLFGSRCVEATPVRLAFEDYALDPAVRAFVAARATGPVTFDAPADVVSLSAWFAPYAATPEAPPLDGLRVHLPEVVVARRAERLPLSIAFTLPLRPPRMAQPDTYDAWGREVVATVRATVVLVPERRPTPRVAQVDIACHTLVPSDSPDGVARVRARVVLDLFQMSALPIQDGRYTAWVFVGCECAGPLALTMIAPKMVGLRSDEEEAELT